MSSPHPERVVLAHHAAAVRHLKAVKDRREAAQHAAASHLARLAALRAKPAEGKVEP